MSNVWDKIGLTVGSNSPLNDWFHFFYFLIKRLFKVIIHTKRTILFGMICYVWRLFLHTYNT